MINGHEIKPYANLRDADLRGADLQGADLRDADLRDADLRGADLRGADLQGADLRGVDHDHKTKWTPFQIPQEGSLVVYKKLFGGHIATLEIPVGARRTATPVGRKCRAEEALVRGITGAVMSRSQHDPSFMYQVGKTVKPDHYDHSFLLECTGGIHFFLTIEEAEDY